jgi:hypothetical protein
MKYRLQNHYGSQEQWEQITNVSLGYDFAYKPDKLLQGPNYCFFTTVPYNNQQEHDIVKSLGGQLVKMVPMRANYHNFELFLKTMDNAPTIQKKITTLKDRKKYHTEYVKYCQHHYLYDLSLGILHGNPATAINDYCKRWGASSSSVKRSLRRVTAGKTKVNYVAGWYYKEVLKNESYQTE